MQKNLIVQEWEKDPEYSKLPANQKAKILGNLFQKEVGGDIQSVPPDEQQLIRNKFIAENMRTAITVPDNGHGSAPDSTFKAMKEGADVARSLNPVGRKQQEDLPDRPGVTGVAKDIGAGAASGVKDMVEMGARAVRSTDLPGDKETLLDKVPESVKSMIPPLKIWDYATSKDVFRKLTTPVIEKTQELEEDYPNIFKPSKQSEDSYLRQSLYGGFRAMGPSALTMFVPGVGGSLFAASEFDRYMDEAQKQGKTVEESLPYATASAAIEGGFEALAGVIGAKILGLKGDKLLPYKNTVKEMLAKRIPRYFKDAMALFATEIPTEMAQESGEAALRQKQGLETVDPMTAGLSVVGPTAVMSLIFHAGGSALNYRQRTNLRNALVDPTADIEDRAEAVQTIAESVAQKDPDMAKMWTDYAVDMLDNDKPIPIDQAIADLKIPEAPTKDFYLDELSKLDLKKPEVQDWVNKRLENGDLTEEEVQKEINRQGLQKEEQNEVNTQKPEQRDEENAGDEQTMQDISERPTAETGESTDVIGRQAVSSENVTERTPTDTETENVNPVASSEMARQAEGEQNANEITSTESLLVEEQPKSGEGVREQDTEGQEAAPKSEETKQEEALKSYKFNENITGMPLYDDILKKPDYYKENKGLTARKIIMSPSEYIDTVVDGAWKELTEEQQKQITKEDLKQQTLATRGEGQGIENVSNKIRQEYLDRWNKGEQPPMPVIEYGKYGFNQEGIHRALMAKQVGLTKMPVLVVIHKDSKIKPTLQHAETKKTYKIASSETAKTGEDIAKSISDETGLNVVFLDEQPTKNKSIYYFNLNKDDGQYTIAVDKFDKDTVLAKIVEKEKELSPQPPIPPKVEKQTKTEKVEKQPWEMTDKEYEKGLLYHGTWAELGGLKKEIPKEYIDPAGKPIGLYLTDNIEQAKTFGDSETILKILKPEKVLDLTDKKTFEDFVDFLPINKKKSLYELKRMKSDSAWHGNIEMEYKLLEDLNYKFDIVKKLKKQGYEGIKFNETHKGIKGKTTVVFDWGKAKLAKAHKEVIKQALSENKPVPLEVLKDYSGEKWADDAIAKLSPKPPVSAEVEKPVKKDNKVIYRVRDYNGNKITDLAGEHDGTPDNIMFVAEKLKKRAFKEIGDFSNVESQFAVTENGKTKWTISPNLAHLAEVGTSDARYILGDLSAKEEVPSQPAVDEATKVAPQVQPGEIEASPTTGDDVVRIPKREEEYVVLKRGDSKEIKNFALSKTDPMALFGSGIYATDSPRIAKDYTAKGAKAFFRGKFKTKQDAIDRMIRREAREFTREGKRLVGTEAMMASIKALDAFGKDDIKIEYAKKWWEANKQNYEVRKQVDGDVVIREKIKTGKVTDITVPKEWIDKTLNVELEVPKNVIDALESALIKVGDKTTAEEMKTYVKTRQQQEEYSPSYREIFSSILGNSPLFTEEGQTILRRKLKDLGYKGLRYNGGTTMGGGKHNAYVFWDEQGLKKEQKNYDRLKSNLKKVGKSLSKKGGLTMDVKFDPKKAEAFSKWFAGSKVVDKDGKPKPVYHSTSVDKNFEKFKRRRIDIGIHFGTLGQAEDRWQFKNRHTDKGIEKTRIIPVYLKIKNPLRIEDPGWFDAENIAWELSKNKSFSKDDLDNAKAYNSATWLKNLRDLIERKGYDGLVYRNTGEVSGSNKLRKRMDELFARIPRKIPSQISSEEQQTPEYKEYRKVAAEEEKYRNKFAEDSYVVFYPTQIKSIYNTTFDPQNPNFGLSQKVTGEPDLKTLMEISEDLNTLASDVYRKGATKLSDFTAEMKRTLGEVWEKVKHLMVKLWIAAKNKLKEERGSFSNKPKTLQEVVEKKKAEQARVLAGGKNETGKMQTEATTEKTINPETIRNTLSQSLGVPIRKGHYRKKVKGKLRAGIFKEQAEVARVEDFNDLGSIIHEAAHFIWKKHNILDIYQDNNEAAKELSSLDYDPTKGRENEGFSEYIRLRQLGENVEEKAPEFNKLFNDYLNKNKDLKTILDTNSEQIGTFQKQGALNRIKAQVDFKGEGIRNAMGEKMQRGWLKFKTLFTDRLAAIEYAEKKIRGVKEIDLRKIDPATSPTAIARFVNKAATAKARSMVEGEGTVNFAGKKTGQSLKEAISELDKKEYQDFIAYAFSRRAQDLFKRNINPGIYQRDADYVVENLKSDKFDRVLQAVTDFENRILDYVIEAGGLTQEAKETMRALNPVHIPLKRVFDDIVGVGGKIGSLSSPTKKIKGSSRVIQDPFSSIIENTAQLINFADKVRIGKAFIKLSESTEGAGKFIEKLPTPKQLTKISIDRLKEELKKEGIDLSKADDDLEGKMLSIYTDSKRYFGKDNIVSFWRDGEIEFYEVDKDLYDAFQSVDQYHMQFIEKIVGAPFRTAAKATRVGATGLRVGFSWLTNPIRDVMGFALQTETGKEHEAPRMLGKALLRKIAPNNKYNQLYKSSGVDLSQLMGMDRKSLNNTVGVVLSNDKLSRMLNIVKHPLEAVQGILSIPEAVPRLAEFEELYKQGEQIWGKGSEGALIMAARGASDVTIDFRRAGYFGEWLNRYVPFHTAAIGGITKFARYTKEHPVRSALKGVTMMTLPTIGLWLHNKDEEWYRELPEWLKYGFWNFRIGTQTIEGEQHPLIVRVPRPFEWGVMFASIPESILNYWYTENPEDFKKAMGKITDYTVPPIIDVAGAKQLLEASFNWDTFREQPIVSPFASKVPSEQYNKYTTKTFKEIGKTLGYSPAKAEHIAYGVTGGLALDIVRSLESMGKTKDVKQYADIPIIGRLFVRMKTKEQKIKQLKYDIQERKKEIKDTLKAAIEYRTNGDKKTEQALRKKAEQLKSNWNKKHPEFKF